MLFSFGKWAAAAAVFLGGGYQLLAVPSYSVTYLGGLQTTGLGSALNDSGQVVGYAYNGSSYEAFLYSGGTMTGLGNLNPGGGTYNSSYAYGINNSGQVVGIAYNGSSDEAFLYSGGTMTGLGNLDPGGSNYSYSFAFGIDNSGQVVGSSAVPSGGEAFLYDAGIMYQIDTLLDAASAGWVIYNASAINSLGQIVAYGYNPADGRSGSVLLTPSLSAVPEPGYYAALGIFLAGLVVHSRRRSRATSAN